MYLDELYASVSQFSHHPVIVLNMCESAQLVPSLRESFIDFFLNRGAAAVIGTECPITIAFAHPFAEVLLSGLLHGDDVGEALRSARRALLDLRNPLGLAYTLYGLATTRFKPPPLRTVPLMPGPDGRESPCSRPSRLSPSPKSRGGPTLLSARHPRQGTRRPPLYQRLVDPDVTYDGAEMGVLDDVREFGSSCSAVGTVNLTN